MKKIIAGLIAAFASGMLASPPASADENSYLTDLANSGYTGSIQRWLNMGYTICSLEHRGMPTMAIASAIVASTGDNIYTPDALEIIAIANQHLCNNPGNSFDTKVA